MRIDAAGTQPVFGGLCHQVIGIAGRVKKRPCAEHPYGGQVLTPVTPEFILNRVAGDAVARNGRPEVARTRRNPNYSRD